MKLITPTYADLSKIADFIFEAGTVVEKNNYIIGFAKGLDIPVTLQLCETSPCILINVDFDIINDKIISYYMRGGIYVNIERMQKALIYRTGISINLYSID